MIFLQIITQTFSDAYRPLRLRFLVLYTVISDWKLCSLGALITLIFECYIFISNTWYSSINSSLIFPSGPNPLLIFIFIVWIYIWGISNLRRTLFGRFTRGDRRLWFKSFASFWIFELITFLSIYLISSIMRWGPNFIFKRRYRLPNSIFVEELALFTIIVWLLYLLRFFIKWNSWKGSTILTLLIIAVTSVLIWKDLAMFWGRQSLSHSYGSKWRTLNRNITLYSLCPEWWNMHYIGHSKLLAPLNINDYIDSYSNITSFNLFERGRLLPMHNFKTWVDHSLPFSDTFSAFTSSNIAKLKPFTPLSISEYSTFDFLARYLKDGEIAYHRRIGFPAKRLAMWNIFTILKIWHHTILFFWWFLFLFRLNGTRKNAYSLLSTCFFNVYCCFILSLFVYLFKHFPFYENFLRQKPHTVRGWMFRKCVYKEAFDYIFDLFKFNSSPVKYHTGRLFDIISKKSIKNDYFIYTLSFVDNIYRDSWSYKFKIDAFSIANTLKGAVVWPELYNHSPANLRAAYPLTIDNYIYILFQSNIDISGSEAVIPEGLFEKKEEFAARYLEKTQHEIVWLYRRGNEKDKALRAVIEHFDVKREYL